MEDYIHLGILLIAIAFIVLAIVKLKLHAFLALSIASVFVALLTGIDLQEIGSIAEKGVGGTLGFLAIIIGCGAILGKMLEISGGAYKIATSMLRFFGRKRTDIAMMFVGFIAGIPVFVEVGFVLLVPLVLVVAKEMGISRAKIGIPLATSLMAVHCLVPPHPAATAIVSMLGADMGRVIMWSLMVGLCCAFVGSVLFLRLFSINVSYIAEISDSVKKGYNDIKINRDPNIYATYFVILLPLILMLSKELFHQSSVMSFIGNPIVALLISVIVSYYILGIKQGFKMVDLLDFTGKSFSPIASILLIIGAGGAFNEILIVSHIGESLKNILSGVSISPIVLAWLISVILHICVGSGTVAMISAAGIVAQLDSGVSKEILCLAIGSGAMGGTIVTDSLFWLVKESLQMSLKDMFKYFTSSTVIASVIGLFLSLGLSSFL